MPIANHVPHLIDISVRGDQCWVDHDSESFARIDASRVTIDGVPIAEVWAAYQHPLDTQAIKTAMRAYEQACAQYWAGSSGGVTLKDMALARALNEARRAVHALLPPSDDPNATTTDAEIASRPTRKMEGAL